MTRLSLAFLVLVLANYGARAAEKIYRLDDLEPVTCEPQSFDGLPRVRGERG